MITFEEVLERTERKLDPNQLAAVRCDANCVVSAGAGSGKTTVLSYRFLRLVLERKADCDRILTLTFTRKAAKEMHARIHAQLLQFKQDPYVASQLARFPDATIATLDSFCSTIVRCDCTRYGIATDFSVDDETNRKNARLCAQRFLSAESFPEGARLLSRLYNPEQLLEDVLVKLATGCYTLPDTLHPDLPDLVLEQVRAIYRDARDRFSELLERYRQVSGSTVAMQGARGAAETFLPALAEETDLSALLELLGGPRFFWTKPGRGSGDDYELLKETSDTYKALRKRICTSLAILTNKESLCKVIDFLSAYQKAYQAEKRKTGVLTFGDISSLAVDILKTNPSLRLYFKKQFRYIMIDEFQDNNQQQKDLLYLLAEREDRSCEGIPTYRDLRDDKLFFVGDEKQSIYRFRGADVSVFKQLSSELVAEGGVALSLSTNYRSEPGLIELFNRLFPKVMANEGQPYEADFAELGSRPAKEGIAASCTLLAKPYGKADEGEDGEELALDTDSEAEALALLVREMLDGDGYRIPSPNGPRRPLPSDIALLLRSTGHQLSFEKAFRRHHIPYTLQTARSLMLEAPANDLYNMLQLTMYPGDRLAYLGTLRSPFCNLSDEGILTVMQCYGDGGEPFVCASGLSAEDERRFARCARFFSDLKEYVQTMSLSDIVLRLWYESGYRLSLVSKVENQVYLEHFSFLHRLAKIKEDQGFDLSRFLDFVRENLGQNQKLDDLDIIKERTEGVQVMSIHKSKGLEFPIVLLANSGSTPRPGSSSSLFPIEGTMLPRFFDCAFHETAKKLCSVHGVSDLFDRDEETLKNQAEMKRLLYVAFTRAKTHLVVSGCFTRQNRTTPNNLLLMSCLAMGMDSDRLEGGDDFVQVRLVGDIRESAMYGKREIHTKVAPETVHAWYGNAGKKPDLAPVRYAVTSLSSESGEVGEPLPALAVDSILSSPALQDVESPAADFGTFVHALCESRVLGREVEDPAALVPPSLSARLDSGSRSQLVADAMKLCDNFIESDVYRSYVEGNRVECEVRFFSRAALDGRDIVAEGSIDLLVERPEGLLVIDFKTDAYRDPEVHRKQVETYLEAVRRIYGRPARGCVVFLRDCGSGVWYEGEGLR
jgi:ATP-dependent exoDNAse (exonuclease V) beta subunit